ncbi:class I histocompatibility antigen, F10 alpha chain isoform X2 [Microcaecilia unicolor]|uniref:Class I histocompatibility antigen, F10 alpha chain-like isoform X2 n=1 Tax=Microcaecilia unicolor TaxID=1415580 RepID=A0A6P7XC51_9AMPH|nr:class I histocompatibility antigen, F10 alpha chain-like isoform X2 [Microcaecilia unicolor]
MVFAALGGRRPGCYHAILGSLAVLTLCGRGVVPVSHSLTYMYTATYDHTGLLDFMAEGQVDDVLIDGYNRETQRKVPRQRWMEEALEPEYWERGSQSRRKKELWFQQNVEILRRRTNESRGIHTLQWSHGCELTEDGIVHGISNFAYDGRDFLVFDKSNLRWIAASPYAEVTRHKWNADGEQNQALQGYLEGECLKWLKTFLNFGKTVFKRQAAPQVNITNWNSDDGATLVLSCLATGFYPPTLRMTWLHNESDIGQPQRPPRDILPNSDGTYQLRATLHLTALEDGGPYSCRVEHEALEEPQIVVWDPQTARGRDTRPGIAVGVMFSTLILLALVAAAATAILIIKRRGGNTGSLEILTDDSTASMVL